MNYARKSKIELTFAEISLIVMAKKEQAVTQSAQPLHRPYSMYGGSSWSIWTIALVRHAGRDVQGLQLWH